MAGPGLPAEVTVQRWLNHWVSDVLPLADIAQSTAESYAGIVRLYILPHIGRVRLDQLAPAHVRSMLTKLRAEGLAPNTVRLARSTLRRALRTAEVDGLISRNPAALVDGVKVTNRKEGRTLTPDQARALLKAATAPRYTRSLSCCSRSDFARARPSRCCGPTSTSMPRPGSSACVEP